MNRTVASSLVVVAALTVGMAGQGALAQSPPRSSLQMSKPLSAPAKKTTKGKIKVTVTGSGSYIISGKKYRRQASVSKTFTVRPGRYQVKAPGGTATPTKLAVRKGKTTRVRVMFTEEPAQPPTVPPATPTPSASPTPSTSPTPTPEPTTPGPISLTRPIGLAAGSAGVVDLAPDVQAMTSVTGATSDGPVSWTLENDRLLVAVASGTAIGQRTVTVTGTGCRTSDQCGVSVTVTIQVAVQALQADGDVQEFTVASPDRIAAAVDAGDPVKQYVDEVLVVVGTDETPGGRADADNAADAVGATVSGGMTDMGIYELRWTVPPADLQASLDELNTRPGVQAFASTFGGFTADSAAEYPPGEWSQDSDESLWWWFDQIDAPQAWSVTTGDPALKVGVVELGLVAKNHPDLSVVKGGSATSAVEHTTHVAGLACARANGSQVVGASWGCDVVSPAMVRPAGTKEIVAAVDRAVQDGARIINISMGYPYLEDIDHDGTNETPCVPQAYRTDYYNSASRDRDVWQRVLTRLSDVLFTASAGNYCASNPSSPWGFNGALPNVITVASANSNGHLASSSNYGTGIEIAAPGGCLVRAGEDPLCGLLSTTPPNSVERLNGTSMAAPIVAGVANLVWASHPWFTAGEVGQCITKSATTKVTERDDTIPQLIRDPRFDFPFFARDVYLLDAERAVNCDVVKRVSTDKDDAQANNWSNYAVWSPDGSRVAFSSGASNLVSGDTNNQSDIFVKDLGTGAVQRVSTDKDGGEGNDFSILAAWSPDGTKIVFESEATNLVPGDTNGQRDLFIKNLVTQSIQLVSVDKQGVQADGESFAAAWSPDGSKLAFVSYAKNLVPGDTNDVGDVFVKDLTTGAVRLVSTSSSGTLADEDSDQPIWSPDSSKLVFESDATTLLPGDANGTKQDLFLKDLTTGAIQFVSSKTDGTNGNGASSGPAWSPDGSRIAFTSAATDLVDQDTNGFPDVFVKNLTNNIVVRVSTPKANGQADQQSWVPSWSPDGTRIAFSSFATNLVPGTTVTVGHIYVKELATGEVLIASRDGAGRLANAWSGDATWSPVGSRIVFTSAATNLTPGDTNEMLDIFVKHL